jgi:hypothetical protein
VFLTRVQADTPGWMMMTSTADMISSTIPHETRSRITNGLYDDHELEVVVLLFQLMISGTSTISIRARGLAMAAADRELASSIAGDAISTPASRSDL